MLKLNIYLKVKCQSAATDYDILSLTVDSTFTFSSIFCLWALGWAVQNTKCLGEKQTLYADLQTGPKCCVSIIQE